MRPDEVAEIRNKVFLYRLCDEIAEHDWDHLSQGDTALLWLCRKCGRTPLEMLEQMPLEERR